MQKGYKEEKITKMKGRRGEKMVLGNGGGKVDEREDRWVYSHIGHRGMEGKREAVFCCVQMFKSNRRLFIGGYSHIGHKDFF